MVKNGELFISIIVPCKELDEYTIQCIDHCKRLDYETYEIILLPDKPSNKVIEHTAVIPTGPTSPGAKRNIGISKAKGEICAFIDSDAYPRSDWLKKALKYLKKGNIAAVGGPGLTPPKDSLMQKASGHILSSFMVGGLSRRYKTKDSFYSDDIHSCNFIAWKSALDETSGWNEKYWPGEDTLMCLTLKKAGKTMIEAPDVIVYHHRRPLFKEHLRQILRFGLHRGFFTKELENSFKISYFMPSLLVLLLIVGSLASIFSSLATLLFFIFLTGYILTSLVAAIIEARDVKLIPLVLAGTITTHIVYGVMFMAGLMRRDLKR